MDTVVVLGVAQPDPGAVQALVKLGTIVPPAPSDKPQPPGVALEEKLRLFIIEDNCYA